MERVTSTVEYSTSILNESTATATSSPSTMPSGIRIVILTCMILIDVSALLGNLLVICAFLRTRRLQTVTNYFIASLALADALVAIFVLPLGIYYYQRDRLWKLGLILCDLWVSSDVLLCTSSILNLTCISVDRYMAITKPLTYTAYRSKFLARVMILAVWVVSAVITCPPIFGWRDSNRRQTVEEHYKCELNSARGYVVYSALGSFYIPGVVMIFVYIRIFMVVYDRENLIKKFHIDNNNNHQPSNQNGFIKHGDTLDHKKKFSKISSRGCFCFRKSAPDNRSLKTLTPHQSFTNGVTTEQNGYLIYRFINNNNNNNNNSNSMSYNSNTTSPTHTPPTIPKRSIFCRPCKISKKNMANIPEDVYQYRRSYMTQMDGDYHIRNGDSPCFELKSLEKSLSPLIKSQSRSLEQTTTSKIRDLNTELSHSRKLKAAAAAAAAAAGSKTTANTEMTMKQENELEHFTSSNIEDNTSTLFPTLNESLHTTTQSLTELNQISNIQTSSPYIQTRNQQPKVSPTRARSKTNPSVMMQNITSSTTYPYLVRPKSSIPEPTRINRRMKSSRSAQNSPSAILIENFKQQHRMTRTSSMRSTQSSRSIVSTLRLANRNECSPGNSLTRNISWCCCCCYSTSTNSLPKNKSKQVINYTPNHSTTNDEDDDEKLSSNDNSNRVPIYAPVHPSSLARTSAGSSSGTPGDVHRRERIRFMKEQKTAKTLAVVVGGFILLWLPFFIMYVIPPETHLINLHTVTLITWLGYLNSVINPFIYAYCSKQFRMAFWNITFGLCIKKSVALLPIVNKNKQVHQRRLNA